MGSSSQATSKSASFAPHCRAVASGQAQLTSVITRTWGPDCLAHGSHAIQILARIRAAELHLDGVEAAGHQPLHVVHQLVLGPGEPAAVGGIGLDPLACGAEVAPQGLVRRLAGQVPEREFHRSHTHARRAHAAHEVVGEQHAAHQFLAQHRILTHEQRSVVLVHHDLGGAQARRVAPVHPVAGEVAVRVELHLQELDGLDGRLRVGDGPLAERDAVQARLDVPDFEAHGFLAFPSEGEGARA
jgi:hypothetical protein